MIEKNIAAIKYEASSYNPERVSSELKKWKEANKNTKILDYQIEKCGNNNGTHIIYIFYYDSIKRELITEKK